MEWKAQSPFSAVGLEVIKYDWKLGLGLCASIIELYVLVLYYLLYYLIIINIFTFLYLFRIFFKKFTFTFLYNIF